MKEERKDSIGNNTEPKEEAQTDLEENPSKMLEESKGTRGAGE